MTKKIQKYKKANKSRKLKRSNKSNSYKKSRKNMKKMRGGKGGEGEEGGEGEGGEEKFEQVSFDDLKEKIKDLEDKKKGNDKTQYYEKVDNHFINIGSLTNIIDINQVFFQIIPTDPKAPLPPVKTINMNVHDIYKLKPIQE